MISLPNPHSFKKTMIIYIAEELGCAYSIDTEGTLFYTPLYQDGSINTEDWSEVDLMSLLAEDENIKTKVDEIHDNLIAANRAAGLYYQHA